MLLYKTKIKQSKILKNQKGLFAAECIPKKAVVFIFPLIKNLRIILESDFNKSWITKSPSKKDWVIRKSGVRYIGNIFLYGPSKYDKKTIYLNHSDNPNLLYHCGICFAKKIIKRGEELTINYAYFDTSKSDIFTNVETGKRVKKYNSNYLLKRSTQELLVLLQSK